MKLYLQIFLFSICSNFLAAQIFRAETSYAIKNEPFTAYCDILGDVLPYQVEIKKDKEFYSRCTVDLTSCTKKNTYFGPRFYGYDCGCVDNNNKTIYIKTSSATLEDEGSWICQPLYRYVTPPTTKPVPLFLPVYYGPENISVTPPFVTQQKLTLMEGDTYNFMCNASCNPPCSVNWFKNLTYGSQMISPNGNLTFMDVDKTLHETAYFCKVSNSKLEKEEIRSTLPIQVIHGPDDIQFNVDDTLVVNEGEDVSNISCFADCYPKCTSRWKENEHSADYRMGVHRYPYMDYHYYHRNTIISYSEKMELERVNRRQSGYFTCEMKNPSTLQVSQRNLTLLVHYEPSITHLNISSNVTSEGSEVVIDCSVDSLPPANISWYRSKKKDTVISTDESLVIPEATCSDSDTYTCYADNGVGASVSRSVSLLIKCAPKIDSKSNDNIIPGIPVMAENGGTAVLPIHIIANPKPSFSWYRFYPTGNEKMVTDFRTKQVDTDSSSVLTIENMNDVDFGYYKVYVRNSEGVRSQLFQVIPNSHYNSTLD